MKENSQQNRLNKIKLATVWWKDAFSHNEDVSSGAEVQNSLVCISSGILLERNSESVKLAMDLFDEQDGQQSRSFRNIGVIPIEFIQRIVVQEVEIYDTITKPRKTSDKKRSNNKKKEVQKVDDEEAKS